MSSETACAIINAFLYISIAAMVLGLYALGAEGKSLWPLLLIFGQVHTTKTSEE